MLEFVDMFSALRTEAGAKANAGKYRGKTSLKDGLVNTAVSQIVPFIVAIILAVLGAALGLGIEIILLPFATYIAGLILWLIGDSLAFFVGKLLGGTGDYNHFMGAISYPESAGRVIGSIVSLVPIAGGILNVIVMLWTLNMSAKTIEIVTAFLFENNSLNCA